MFFFPSLFVAKVERQTNYDRMGNTNRKECSDKEKKSSFSSTFSWDNSPRNGAHLAVDFSAIGSLFITPKVHIRG